jgi:phage tail protein X
MNYGNRIYGMWTESTAHLTQRQSRGRAIPWRTGTYYIACNTPTNEIVTINVADMLGKTVIMQTSKCNMGIAYMQQSLPTGVYIASITNANGHKVSKPLIIK